MNDSQLKKEGIRVASNVRNLLKAWNMTVEQLSEATGVSKSTLYRIEGKRRFDRMYQPALKTVKRIAKYVGCNSDEFSEIRIEFEKSQ